MARYFEALPSCFGIKEPRLLAEVGLMSRGSDTQWDEIFLLSVRLLTRTYLAQELPVIKTHVPTNILGTRLLEQNQQATITFIINPLRDFLLSTLKSEDRKLRVRYWNRHSAFVSAFRVPGLAGILPDNLGVPEAVAYWWLVNRFLCQELCSGPYRSRVFAIDGTSLVNSPEQNLPYVMARCGLALSDRELQNLLMSPAARRHAKDNAVYHDSESRRQEMENLGAPLRGRSK